MKGGFEKAALEQGFSPADDLARNAENQQMHFGALFDAAKLHIVTEGKMQESSQEEVMLEKSKLTMTIRNHLMMIHLVMKKSNQMKKIKRT